MFRARSSLRLPAALALLLLGSCAASVQIPPTYGTADLYAIHNEREWTPRSPARLSASPASYEIGFPVEGIRVTGEERWYDVTDHKALELQILDKVAETPPMELDQSLEALAALIVELLHDDHQEARVRSSAIISGFAGAWIERGGTRLQEVDPDNDLARAIDDFIEAVEDVDRADYQERVQAALEGIDAAPIRDPLVAARLVAGMSRKLRSSPLQVTGNQVLMRTAVRTVLLALEQGMADADQVVADHCRVRYDLLKRYAGDL